MVDAVGEAALSVARPEKLPFVYLWVFFASFFLLLLLAAAGEVISTSPPPSTGSRAGLSAPSRSSLGRHFVAFVATRFVYLQPRSETSRSTEHELEASSALKMRPCPPKLEPWSEGQLRTKLRPPPGLLLAASNPHAFSFIKVSRFYCRILLTIAVKRQLT